ncbi:DUF2846 domain-containing protein [Variovorax paradoxus]|uniref:DUF2846 domain-containing protein n=1 Tax=Variovorax paradoxus TaxID=34073 RepID=A0A679JR96_VARPD|nr:hypothetical protein VVAX_05170 [Variovorax paradoxus]
MRRWIGGGLLAVLAAGLFGCAASGPRFSEMAGSMPSLGENEGRIYFYRNSIMGAALQPEVTVNGQVVGKSRPNSFFYIDRPAGTYRASARTEAEATIDVVLRPKQTAYVLMSMNFGIAVGRPGFERVSEAEGRQELQSLAYDDSLPAARTAKAAVPDARPTAPAAPSPVVPAAIATAVVAQPAVAARPIEAIPAPAAAAAAAPTPPPLTAPRVAATAPSETAPFARTPLNDLRLLLPANR